MELVRKFTRKVEENGMSINSVPNLWREKVRKQVEADGYVFDENGYATKVEVVDETVGNKVTEQNKEYGRAN